MRGGGEGEHGELAGGAGEGGGGGGGGDVGEGDEAEGGGDQGRDGGGVEGGDRAAWVVGEAAGGIFSSGGCEVINCVSSLDSIGGVPVLTPSSPPLLDGLVSEKIVNMFCVNKPNYFYNNISELVEFQS